MTDEQTVAIMAAILMAALDQDEDVGEKTVEERSDLAIEIFNQVRKTKEFILTDEDLDEVKP